MQEIPVLEGSRPAVRKAPWGLVIQAAAALAAGMGVGRFVYSPILPLMHAGAGLSAVDGAHLATANYAGYLAGALLGIALPRLARSPVGLRIAFVGLIASLAGMPCAESPPIWMALRFIAGVASALIFVITVNCLHSRLSGHPGHFAGWAFGGIGAGIALSGVLVLVLRVVADWRAAWFASAVLATILAAAAWRLHPDSSPSVEMNRVAPQPLTAHSRRLFAALFTSYTLEGVGYIIAGTFLVAAIEQSSPGGLGSSAWVLVGIAAVPSSALWTWLVRRCSRSVLLMAALLLQSLGIALPALSSSPAAALAAAVLFGGTFAGISVLALAAGAALRMPHAVAVLTSGYSAGQIAGPLLAAPLLHDGYRPALLLASAVVLIAAVAALPTSSGSYPSAA
ncbi:YbfB/YjiJ family MFS transporter [Nocardia sp. NBC_01327]|uniref:YbfB/YjiJ family MFS transporter n=1 Tax=Nocardia sp. NBC_01327 TaxID=2903593 RepID=UPI002E11FDD5|nr:YbfB/YjiJ family MFS transporter [Nocardia sp. NBC_01327]